MPQTVPHASNHASSHAANPSLAMFKLVDLLGLLPLWRCSPTALQPSPTGMPANRTPGTAAHPREGVHPCRAPSLVALQLASQPACQPHTPAPCTPAPPSRCAPHRLSACPLVHALLVAVSRRCPRSGDITSLVASVLSGVGDNKHTRQKGGCPPTLGIMHVVKPDTGAVLACLRQLSDFFRGCPAGEHVPTRTLGCHDWLT